jgi:hypothetical protein
MLKRIPFSFALALCGWACEAKAAGDYHVVLTPSYDSAHRDHLPLDLTPGGDTIKSWDVAEPGGAFYEDVDPADDGLGDSSDVYRLTPLFERELRIQNESGAAIAPVTRE